MQLLQDDTSTTTTYRYHQALSTSTSTDCKLRQTGLSACTQMATRMLCWLWHAWPLPKCPSRAHHNHCQSALPGPKMDACLPQASNQTRVRGRCVPMRTGEHQHMPTPITTADSSDGSGVYAPHAVSRDYSSSPWEHQTHQAHACSNRHINPSTMHTSKHNLQPHTPNVYPSRDCFKLDSRWTCLAYCTHKLK